MSILSHLLVCTDSEDYFIFNLADCFLRLVQYLLPRMCHSSCFYLVFVGEQRGRIAFPFKKC